MKYCDLCQAFYISSTEGVLKEYISQAKISEMLITWAIKSEGAMNKMPTSSSSYDKWYSGETSPIRLWSYVKDELDGSAYSKIIGECIKSGKESTLASNLGIILARGEKLDNQRLFATVAKVVYELAESGGEIDDKFPNSTYIALEIKTDFSEYIHAKTDYYNVMKLIGGGEVLLDDYFVCNTIGEKLRVGFDKTKDKVSGAYLEDATLEKLRNMYSKRGFDNRKVLLLGSGGSGKTLMMQHLFLDSISRFQETGILPVFLELRNMKLSDSITGFIAEALNVSGDEFDEKKVDLLLQDGKLHILFDGLDEVDPSGVDDFLRKLTSFAEKYRKVQIVIASRDCAAVNGVRQFMHMYVWPFNDKQSMLLIKKILEKEGALDSKDEVLGYIDKGFIKKNGVFASHPMLLTFVAKNVSKLHEFSDNHLRFYKLAYEAMLSGHDENKKPYDRVFISVDNASDFTKVFGEFCAKTYILGLQTFELEQFEMYFGQLTSVNQFENTHKLDVKNFMQDACSTACMMYEKDDKVVYIDPGFQAYLFADYYLKADASVAVELGEQLINKAPSLFENEDAFDMIYQLEKKKFEYCILKPFLEDIFKGHDEDEAFRRYLMLGYDHILYTVLNSAEIDKHVNRKTWEYNVGIFNLNDSRTVVLTYIMHLLGLTKTTIFVTENLEAAAGEFVSPVYGRYENNDGVREFSLSTFYSDQLFKENFGGDEYEYVKAENSKPVIMGKTYSVDTLEVLDEPEKYSVLIDSMKEESQIYKDFLNIKFYYEKIVREQRRDRVITR